MARAVILVLDSVGIGGAPDADMYGDKGADTIGHIAKACAAGSADRHGLRRGPLTLPHMAALGLGEACGLATGEVPECFKRNSAPEGRYGCAAEKSKGKDTPSGHWELAGVPVLQDWGYFPRTIPCFSADLIDELCRRAGLAGILGNRHASGTEIIVELGEDHIHTGRPICYTSADSVFQIAAHETAFGLDRLYAVCVIARELVDSLHIGRVIARPFTGSKNTNFTRTANRRDFATAPPSPTLLDIATASGRDVVTIGKIGDIFAHSGTGRIFKGADNAALFDRMMEGFETLADGGILMANFIDFDSVHGHRRDTAGYAAALEYFDGRLIELMNGLGPADLAVITADHGCDPTWTGTDHTREQVPILAFGPAAGSAPIGRRETFADVAATVARHIGIPPSAAGSPF